jgi:two-component system sensor histidine kinase BaeS
MTSLRLRLTLTYLAVILVGMGIAAPLAWLTVEGLYLDTQRDNLLAQAQLVARSLETAPNVQPPADPYSQAANVQPGIHTRVIEGASAEVTATQPATYSQLANVQPGVHTHVVEGPTPSATAAPSAPYSQVSNVAPGVHSRIIEEQGAAVIDVQSPVPVEQKVVSPLPQLAQNAAGEVSPQELLSRPEVTQALAGRPATAVRRVAVAGDRRVLYAAAPIEGPDGRVSRIVYLASPLPDLGLAALPVTVRWQLAGVLLAAVALSGAVGWWLSRRIARPLDDLARAADAVAAGDLGQAVPEDAAIADLRAVGRAFNVMTASLRAADQAKTAFVADVSHELRTPLTVIKGTIETLQDGALDDLDARDGFLASMANETERLIRLVNDLLVLTRADAGALNLQRQPLDLGDLARARVEHLVGLAARRDVSLCVVAKAPAPTLADPDRIAQVLDNLLDNAIRHSRPGEQVTVAVAPAGGEATCSVADTGPGIPAQHLPFIFDRFYRADAARSRSRGGSGLGLSIARALVLAHGGHIAVQSVENQGTTLTFRLPAA